MCVATTWRMAAHDIMLSALLQSSWRRTMEQNNPAPIRQSRAGCVAEGLGSPRAGVRRRRAGAAATIHGVETHQALPRFCDNDES